MDLTNRKLILQYLLDWVISHCYWSTAACNYPASWFDRLVFPVELGVCEHANLTSQSVGVEHQLIWN